MNCFLLSIIFCLSWNYALSFSFPEYWEMSTRLCMTNDDENEMECGRRHFLSRVAPTFFGFATFDWARSASANDEIFKPNPLTNPFLEQVRIWEQAEADEMKYGGELAPGDAGNKGKVDAYPKLLVPILNMNNDLQKVDSLVHGSKTDWREALKILQDKKFDKVAFKKTFNAFGDNIYYSDPDRANVYLGGGATPKNEQSLAYLLRNEILTNIEDLQAELEYLLKENESDTEELYRLSRGATTAMSQYLENVSPAEMKRAKELLASFEG